VVDGVVDSRAAGSSIRPSARPLIARKMAATEATHARASRDAMCHVRVCTMDGSHAGTYRCACLAPWLRLAPIVASALGVRKGEVKFVVGDQMMRCDLAISPSGESHIDVVVVAVTATCTYCDISQQGLRCCNACGMTYFCGNACLLRQWGAHRHECHGIRVATIVSQNLPQPVEV
jgi:hypothetical protein